MGGYSLALLPTAMPIYDFECAGCGRFEIARRIAERDDAAACPSCGESAARVIAGAPSLGNGDPADSPSAGGYGMRHMGSCACCR
jgi:putative FmdB family regulatory protein